jgi:AcrR family transcriptional regulator
LARQVDRREATRAALVEAARHCFSELGYEASSMDVVLARAGVSKGAMYHHFESKTALLAAVFNLVSRETMATAQAAAIGAGSFRAGLALGMKTWLRAVMTPEAMRIVLDIGPAVMGLAQGRQAEASITQAPVRRTLEAAIDRREIQPIDVGLVARVLTAAVGELALIAAERGLQGSGLDALDERIDDLIDALAPPVRDL